MLQIPVPRPFDLEAEKKKISGEYEKLIKESRNSAHYILNHMNEIDIIINNIKELKDQGMEWYEVIGKLDIADVRQYEHFLYNGISISSHKSAKENAIECFKREKYFRKSKDDELLYAEGLATLTDEERGILDVAHSDIRGYGLEYTPDPYDSEIYERIFEITEKLKPYSRITGFNEFCKKKSENLMILLDRYTDEKTGTTWHIESRSSHTF